MDKNERARAALLAVSTLVLLMPLARSAGATGVGHTGPTVTRLEATAQTESVEHHDSAAGGWSFTAEGNTHVRSVRLAIYGATGPSCAELSGEPLYEDKITDDELASGPVVRSIAFDEGAYCSALSLDGARNAVATIETSHPEPVDPEPEVSSSPTESVSPSPIEPTDPPTSVEYDRCSDDSEVDHRVLAGATGPKPESPFIYQKFYPSTLQVHSGDLVEWCFNGAYDWHTVTFLPVDMDVAAHPEPSTERPNLWRWDETGQKAFNEDWLFGPERGDEKSQCGRGEYFAAPAQEECVLSGTDQWVSSTIWDRFFSTGKTGTFSTRIDLPPGLYRYHCNIHSSMEGFIEVLPPEQTPANPTPAEIDQEIAADHAEAQKVFRELSDPSDAYDFAARRWTVRVGAETPDRSVAIEQFIPSRIDVRKGDTVHFVAGTDEPNTVTFPGGEQLDGVPESDPQGGFSVQGECNAHSCPTGRGGPWGMTGLAFVWNCDADGRSSGLPGSLPYLPAATAARANAPEVGHGCIAGGLPEMITQPWYGEQQPAPGNLVASEKTFHNSGALLDVKLPDWYRRYPASHTRPEGEFPHTFDAKFPTSGTFKYFCAAHEFMKGMVVVK